MSIPEIQSYSDAMKWISDRIDYEKIRPRKSSRHFRLERMTALLGVIGSPEKRIPVVHIAGTKGKGTTAAILHSILVASDVRTGLFISPHLDRFEERMRVGHELPSQQLMTELVNELACSLRQNVSDIVEDGPTYFEIATLLAWMHFDRSDIDVAVLETGLGGRLDCTNSCRPILTMITSIGLDHTEVLGDTLAAIAAEKAGIIKPGIPCLTAAHQTEVLNVLHAAAGQNSAPLTEFQSEYAVTIDEIRRGSHQVMSLAGPATAYKNLKLPLLGAHQAVNAGLAVAAAQRLADRFPSIGPQSIREGVESVSWPIRFEIIESDHTIILDAAHNPDSVRAFVQTYKTCFPDQPSVVLFGGSQDKDVREMLTHLLAHMPMRVLILSRYSGSHRAADPEELRRMVQPMLTGEQRIIVAAEPEVALKSALKEAKEGETLSILGSIFFSAQVRRLLSN